jgi:hypothetical protein
MGWHNAARLMGWHNAARLMGWHNAAYSPARRKPPVDRSDQRERPVDWAVDAVFA